MAAQQTSLSEELRTLEERLRTSHDISIFQVLQDFAGNLKKRRQEVFSGESVLAVEAPGLYRIEVSSAAGVGNVRITNVSPPGSLRESVQTAHQNLLARNRELVGDRDARQQELNVQVRAMDVSKGGFSASRPFSPSPPRCWRRACAVASSWSAIYSSVVPLSRSITLSPLPS